MASLVGLAKTVRLAVPAVLFSSIVYSVAADAWFGMFRIAGRYASNRFKIVVSILALVIDVVVVVFGAYRIAYSCPLGGEGLVLSSTNIECYPTIAIASVGAILTMWIDRMRWAFLDREYAATSMTQRLISASVVAVGWLGLVSRDVFCIVNLGTFVAQRRMFPRNVSFALQGIVFVICFWGLATGQTRKPACISMLACLGDVITRTRRRKTHLLKKEHVDF
jgi:hypothetical protein